MKDQLLIIFVKNPQLGRAKTRLAATIGEVAALEAYKRLLKRTAEITAPLNIEKVVYYDQFVDREDLWSNNLYHKDLQIEGNLGEKMKDAFDKAFEKGYQRICIIGSDCYDLTTELLHLAFDNLSNKDAVIGPSEDGGYYLLGLSKPCSALFENKQWSTDSVCADTEADLKNANFSYEKIELLSDVDTEKDLGEWADDLVKTKL